MTNRELLEAAVKEFGSHAALAKHLGYSRTIVSLIASDKYDADTAKFYECLRKKCDFILNAKTMCPGLKGAIDARVCEQYRKAKLEGKTLKGSAFVMATSMCHVCPRGGSNEV